jgi:hypothetical protein
MPTTLPERRTISRDKPIPIQIQVGAAVMLIVAACVTVVIMDHAGLSFDPDGDGLVQLSAGSPSSLPIGFRPQQSGPLSGS